MWRHQAVQNRNFLIVLLLGMYSVASHGTFGQCTDIFVCSLDRVLLTPGS